MARFKSKFLSLFVEEVTVEWPPVKRHRGRVMNYLTKQIFPIRLIEATNAGARGTFDKGYLWYNVFEVGAGW